MSAYGCFPGYSLDAPLDLGQLPDDAVVGIVGRLADGSHRAFSEAAARVGNCAHPIRLHGHSHTVDRATGAVVGTFTSDDAPLGVVMVPCGNRRATVCPACSRTYAADTFQMIRSGVSGGKTVPDRVASHPLVFATLTAPSFGHVHGDRDGKACRPATHGPLRCAHGRPTTCRAVHGEDDDAIGQPLCDGCYDYATHVLWQYHAPELWRRFTIALRRSIARSLGVSEATLKDLVTVQFAKVAEYQRRGVIHFHALIRLDGPKTDEGYADPPARFTAALLAEHIATAARAVLVTAPPPVEGDPDRLLRFGRQLDARPVTTSSARAHGLDGETLSAEQVAGYLAKYATKSCGEADMDNAHTARLRGICREYADAARLRERYGWAIEGKDGRDVYAKLGNWVHMLGFRGHFATKSRRYSITLGRLRRARRRFAHLAAEAARTGQPLDVADLEARLLLEDDEETTLVVGSWTYAGTGWPCPGDAELALAAAARAREYAQWRAERRKHQQAPQRGRAHE